MEEKMTIKLVIGNKDGKTTQTELNEDQTNYLMGKKITEKISGDDLGFEGYEFEITGGSNNSGTPMRRDIEGPIKKKIFTVQGVGVRKKGHGQKQRKTVCGNIISETISQVNVKIIKAGKIPLGGAEEKTEDKTEEKTTAEEKK
jgi:small subunit ribosomal protein S6e